jgi:hypothetical protein
MTGPRKPQAHAEMVADRRAPECGAVVGEVQVSASRSSAPIRVELKMYGPREVDRVRWRDVAFSARLDRPAIGQCPRYLIT